VDFRTPSLTQGLNKLISTYERMTEQERLTLKNTELSCKEVADLKEEFRSEFIELDKRRREYAQYIDSSMESQKNISSQIRNSSRG